MFVGTWLAGVVAELYSHKDSAGEVLHSWQQIWTVPAIMSAVVLVAFALFFKDEEPAVE